MLSPELYGLLLAAAVLAIIGCILALERFKMKVNKLNDEMIEIYPPEPAVVEPGTITKGGSQGI